jgi:hypothetical protein
MDVMAHTLTAAMMAASTIAATTPAILCLRRRNRCR